MALSNRLTPQKQAWFFSQLAALLKSGMTPQQSLNLVARDCAPSFQRYLHHISAAMEGGLDLASALAVDSRYFDGWTISLIRLAEYSGSLPQTCTQLAIAAEARLRWKRLYRSVRLRAIATVWSLLILTAVIFNPSPKGFIKPEFWLRSLAIALLLLAISFLASRYFRRGSQPWVMNLPILGSLIQARSMLYLTELQLPLSCGVSLLAALDLVREHIPDFVMRSNLSTAARKLRSGQTLSRSLKGKLPPIAMQMIITGEETGNLDTAFQNIAQYYEGELERRLSVLQSRLKPLSLLAIASLVAVVGIRGITLLLNSLPN